MKKLEHSSVEMLNGWMVSLKWHSILGNATQMAYMYSLLVYKRIYFRNPVSNRIHVYHNFANFYLVSDYFLKHAKRRMAELRTAAIWLIATIDVAPCPWRRPGNNLL